MPDDIAPLTAQERAALAVLAGAATPGPWEWNSYDGIFAQPDEGDDADAVAWVEDVPNTDEQHGDSLHTEQGRANARFIAACREGLPRALATCDVLEAKIKAHNEVHALEAQQSRGDFARYDQAMVRAERAQAALREIAGGELMHASVLRSWARDALGAMAKEGAGD